MGLSWEMVKKFYNRNKRLNPKDLNEFLKSFDRMYHRSVATGHSILAGEELDKEFQNQILELKEFLEKVKIQK
jgi:phosphomevalonate kinase